jgi:hypothetical protein
LLAVDEFLLEILNKRAVQVELSFESAIGQAASTLQHGNRLIQNLLKGHHQALSCLAGSVTEATCTQDLAYPGSILGGKLGLRGRVGAIQR